VSNLFFKTNHYHTIEIGMKCNLFYDSFSRGCDPENIISTTSIANKMDFLWGVLRFHKISSLT
jgi:hypothetical protein